MKKMITILGVILFSWLAQASDLEATRSDSKGRGREGGGGSFQIDRPKELLEIARQEVLTEIDQLQTPTLKKYPQLRGVIREALMNRIEHPNDPHFRDGKKLIFDYQDEVRPYNFIAAQDYYESFGGVVPEQYSVSLPEIKRRMLHEPSHIIGFNDEEARAFSEEAYPIGATSPNGEKPPVVAEGNICAKKWNAKKVKFKNVNCNGQRLGAIRGTDEFDKYHYKINNQDIASYSQVRANMICMLVGFSEAETFLYTPTQLVALPRDYSVLYVAVNFSWVRENNFYYSEQFDENHYGSMFSEITCVTKYTNTGVKIGVDR